MTGKRVRPEEMLANAYRENRGFMGWLKRVHFRVYKLFHFHLLWLFRILSDRLDDRMDQVEARVEERLHLIQIGMEANDLAARITRADPADDTVRLKKDWNASTAGLHKLYRDGLLTSMPVVVNLAGSTRCNLQCVMCSRGVEGHAHHNRIDPLPEDLFVSFASQTFPAARYVRLNTSGEPLLSSSLELEVKLVREHGVKILLITNGTVKDRLAWETVLPLCAQVDISLDSPVPETYEAIRIGAGFRDTLENLVMIRDFTDSLPVSSRPELYLGMTLMKQNLPELPLMVDLCHYLGFDGVRGSLMIPYSKEMKEQVVHPDDNRYRLLAAAAAVRAAAHAVSLDVPGLSDLDASDRSSIPLSDTRVTERLKAMISEVGRIPAENPPLPDPNDGVPSEPSPVPSRVDLFSPVRRNRQGEAIDCPFLWEQIFLDGEARIFTCCEPSHPVIGSVREKPVEEIWNDERYVRMRENFKPGSRFFRRHPLCGRCAKSGFLKDNF